MFHRRSDPGRRQRRARGKFDKGLSIVFQGQERNDLRQSSFAADGARGTVLSSEALLASGRTALTFSGEASLARVEVVGNGAAINALTADALKLRLALEDSHAHTLASGATLTPALELGAPLRYRDPPNDLTVERHGRTLVSHSGSYDEWGVKNSCPQARDVRLPFRSTLGVRIRRHCEG